MTHMLPLIPYTLAPICYPLSVYISLYSSILSHPFGHSLFPYLTRVQPCPIPLLVYIPR